MTLSKEYTDKIIRHELVQAWNEYEPKTLRCYSNVADRYMREKARAMSEEFDFLVAAKLAAEIAWWVQESCSKRRKKP